MALAPLLAALAALAVSFGGCATQGGVPNAASSATTRSPSGGESGGDSGVGRPGPAGTAESTPTPGGPDGGDPQTAAARRAAGELLGARSAALAGRDREGWVATVADPASDDGRRQGAAYDALVALGVRELRVGAVRDLPGATASGTAGPAGPAGQTVTWTGTVEVSWAIPGYDVGARRTTRTVTLVATSAGWRVGRDGGPTDHLQVWDLGPIHVERSPTTLVAGNADVATLQSRLADADAAQPRLARLFGAPVQVVLVVPADAAQAARQLGHLDAASLGSLAAATDGALGPDGRAVADRVVINPAGFAVLTDEGRRVVVAHELAHVAARATMPGDVPTWLSEGLAEYVGLQAVSLPDTTVAGRLLEQVRAQGPPPALPTTAQFDPSQADAPTAYQGAWLAVRAIAVRFGEPTLLAFYRATASGSGPGVTAASPPDAKADAALREVLATTPEDFVVAWRSELARLAGR